MHQFHNLFATTIAVLYINIWIIEGANHAHSNYHTEDENSPYPVTPAPRLSP